MFNLPDNFLMFIIASFIASAFPGLAVMGSFTTGLKHGFKAATIFSLGLVSASILYFILSAFGLIILVEKYENLFFALKYLGIAYLFYLGIQSIKSKDTQLDFSDPNSNKKSYYQLFFSGFLIHLANPKNILFFVALLPQYLNINQPVKEQMFWLCLGAEIPEFLILISYAYFAKIIKPFLLKESVAKWFNKVIGALFISLAIVLFFH